MKKRIFQEKSPILANKNIGGNFFKMSLKSAGLASCALPGQFVMVKAKEGSHPLLRRPLGIHSVKNNRIELLYEVVGEGTRLLSEKKTGEGLDMIGPLGNGFDIGRDEQYPVLIAGGMGVAPLLFLAEKLKIKNSDLKTLVILGARTKDAVVCEKEFKDMGCNVKISTDDGSKGFKGSACELLEQAIGDKGFRASVIYACGPLAMLERISRLSRARKIDAFGSFEAHMACGIGACLGCAIKIKSEGYPSEGFLYRRVCKDGPVFKLEEVLWDAKGV